MTDFIFLPISAAPLDREVCPDSRRDDSAPRSPSWRPLVAFG